MKQRTKRLLEIAGMITLAVLSFLGLLIGLSAYFPEGIGSLLPSLTNFLNSLSVIGELVLREAIVGGSVLFLSIALAWSIIQRTNIKIKLSYPKLLDLDERYKNSFDNAKKAVEKSTLTAEDKKQVNENIARDIERDFRSYLFLTKKIRHNLTELPPSKLGNGVEQAIKEYFGKDYPRIIRKENEQWRYLLTLFEQNTPAHGLIPYLNELLGKAIPGDGTSYIEKIWIGATQRERTQYKEVTTSDPLVAGIQITVPVTYYINEAQLIQIGKLVITHGFDFNGATPVYKILKVEVEINKKNLQSVGETAKDIPGKFLNALAMISLTKEPSVEGGHHISPLYPPEQSRAAPSVPKLLRKREDADERAGNDLASPPSLLH